MVARAVVARALAEARERAGGQAGLGPDALYLADKRDATVAAITVAAGVPTMGLAGWLGDILLKIGEATGTAWGKGRRTGLMSTVSPGVGDILLYQRRGDPILDYILTAVPREDDVYLIGHSLGGVMLVDLMSGPSAPGNVKGLITVGSQAPFFYVCNALASLRPPNVRAFVPWLNLYDRNDFLSFCATRKFPGVPNLLDAEVSSGVPFPDAHGAYWRMDEVYRLIAEHMQP